MPRFRKEGMNICACIFWKVLKESIDLSTAERPLDFELADGATLAAVDHTLTISSERHDHYLIRRNVVVAILVGIHLYLSPVESWKL